MKKGDWFQIMRGVALLTELGLVIVVNIGAGFFLGSLLDNWIGIKILFKIIGMLIGVISGFYSDYKLIKKISDDF